MTAKAHDLFEGVASFPVLHAAALRAARGKQAKPGPAAFLAELETEILRLQRELRDGRYRPAAIRPSRSSTRTTASSPPYRSATG